MTEYDLIKDWTLHAGIDEEAAKRVLFRLKLEDGFKSFLDHEDLRDDLEMAEAEVKALNKKVEQLGNMIETLEDTLGDLTSTNDDLEASNKDLETELYDLTFKIEETEAQLDALQKIREGKRFDQTTGGWLNP